MFFDLPPEPVLLAQVEEDNSDNDERDEIVITGKRLTAPKVEDFAPVVSLDTADVGLMSYDTVGEVIDEAISMSGSEAPQMVFLVNGKPGMHPQVFRQFPAEAVERVDVLPPGAAGPLGYPANATVINTILKDNFHALTAEGAATVPANRVNASGELELSDARSWGNKLLLTDLKVTDQSMVTESEALGCPDTAIASCDEDSPFRSVVAEETGVEAGVAAAGYLAGFAFSGFGRVSQTEGTDLLGLFPGDTPSGIILDRDSETVSAGLTVYRQFGERFFTAETEVSRADSTGETSGTPFAIADYDRTATTFKSELELSSPVWRIPAGQIRANGSVSFESRETENTTGADDTESTVSTDITRLDGGLYIPLTKSGPQMGPWGGSGLNLRAFGTEQSGSDGSQGLEASLRLRANDKVTLSLSLETEDTAPSFDQLDDAARSVPNMRFYDYRNGETVEVTSTYGGNTGLTGQSRDTFEASVNLTPVKDRSIFARFAYKSEKREDLIRGSLPNGPFTEDAFPDRFVRDDESNLVSVDLRPVNLAAEETQELTTFMTFRKGGGGGWGGRGGGGRGGPPMGGRPGGPGGPGGGEQRGKEFRVQVWHSWTIEDSLQLSDSQPFQDAVLVEGGGSTPEHRMSLALIGSNPTLTGRLNFYYQSERDGTAGGTLEGLHYEAFTTLGAELDINLDKPFGKAFDKTRLSFEFDNILDEKGRITDRNGVIPEGYEPDLRDPLGRRVTVKLRRQF